MIRKPLSSRVLFAISSMNILRQCITKTVTWLCGAEIVQRVDQKERIAKRPKGNGMKDNSQTTGPRLQKFSITRRQYDQAWVWSPRLNEWLLVYDCKQAWAELNDLPSIGIKKPDHLPEAVECAPAPKPNMDVSDHDDNWFEDADMGAR